MQKYAGELIKQNLVTVGKSKEFVQLSWNHIKDIILCDDTINGTEEDIFEIILEWIWKNQKEREPCFAELFRHV